jgi:hypothetical protein
VAAVFRATNLTASATANIPFALVDKSGKDYDVSTEWENKVIFMPKPKELIRLWRLSLIMTNEAYGFMENKKDIGKNLRYIVPTTIAPITDNEKGLTGFKRTIGTGSKDYQLGKSNPIFWMWRMDHTTELLPAKATEFQAMCAAAGILYYSDHFVNAFFKRGGIKPTMLVLKGMTTKENIDKIESVWDKIIKGGYKYLGKIFQGVDTNGGLEAQTIGEGVDTLKDETLTKSKIEDVAMSIGMPLSLLLANSANYATALVEYKEWYENSLAPWCDFMAEEMTDKLFKPLGYRFEFRPEMTDPGQEDEVARAGAYSTYVTAKIKPSVAAQIVGIELPEGIEYEMLDQMQVDADQAAADAQSKLQQDKLQLLEKQSSSDNGKEKPATGWVTINGNHVLIEDNDELAVGDNVIINDPDSKHDKMRGVITNIANDWSTVSFENNESEMFKEDNLQKLSNNSNIAKPTDKIYENIPKKVQEYIISKYDEISKYNYLGVRTTQSDEKYNIGDMTRNSLDWDFELDRSSSTELDGISTTMVGNNELSSPSDLLDSIQISLERHSYGSGNIVLVGGDYGKIGDDPGEVIIKNGRVLAIIRDIKTKKFIPNIDQLKEMELWRKFAFRKFKKGESLDFPFEIKTLPDEISEDIKLQLLESTDEEGIKAAFTLDEIQFEPMQDTAILKLADAINKACENVAVPD